MWRWLRGQGLRTLGWHAASAMHKPFLLSVTATVFAQQYVCPCRTSE